MTERVRDGGDGAAVAELGAGQLMMMLAGRLRRARLTALEPFGLAPHQARAFMIIGRHSRRGDLRPSDLARRLDIAPRSATEVVDALQDKGLIERTLNPDDRRARVLRLTEAGDDLFGRMHRGGNSDDAPAADLFAALTADELVELTALLRKAAAAGEKGCGVS